MDYILRWIGSHIPKHQTVRVLCRQLNFKRLSIMDELGQHLIRKLGHWQVFLFYSLTLRYSKSRETQQNSAAIIPVASSQL